MFVSVDFEKPIRAVKPLHGVNNGPLSCSFLRDASALWHRAGIPYARLHDTEGAYGAGEYVDIPAVFKCFDADPEDPASYNFYLTDKYIDAIRATGAKVIYRLGVSIENGPYKRYIHPPKDYMQWARICEGIIKHYTQGFADGYDHAVEYFEIWNEPEFRDHMWTGTDEEFYKLFKDTILYLKKKFPDVKIGGPGNGQTRPEFTEGFFRYLTTGEKAPLDFYSWHQYFSSLERVSAVCEDATATLERYGYGGVEQICTEWNLVEDWANIEVAFEKIGDERGGAFVACALCLMQKQPLDIAAYYDSRLPTKFNGLYEQGTLHRHDGIVGMVPKPSFFSFECYNELYTLGTEVASSDTDSDVCVLAATDGHARAMMIARYDPSSCEEKAVDVELHTDGSAQRYTVYRYAKEERTMLAVEQGSLSNEVSTLSLTLSPYDMALIKLAV